jgi:hypothetical protein
MTREEARMAADSLMEHLKLSAAQATILLDETVPQPLLRVFVFDKSAVGSRHWPARWRGFPVEVVLSKPFRAAFNS